MDGFQLDHHIPSCMLRSQNSFATCVKCPRGILPPCFVNLSAPFALGWHFVAGPFPPGEHSTSGRCLSPTSSSGPQCCGTFLQPGETDRFLDAMLTIRMGPVDIPAHGPLTPMRSRSGFAGNSWSSSSNSLYEGSSRCFAVEHAEYSALVLSAFI